jgi:uncharacterized protein YggE
MTRTITVRGRGVAPARPTEALLTLEVAAVRATSAEAFAEAEGRNAALDALCERLGIGERDRTTTSTSVHEYREGVDDPITWRASYSITVRLHDPEVATRLLREAVVDVGARVAGGPWWRVGPDDPSHLEACRHAAADAERRATVYAEAFGLRRGDVVRAVEVGASDLGEEFPPRAGFAPLDFSAELRPGTAEVSAAVDVAYELEARA